MNDGEKAAEREVKKAAPEVRKTNTNNNAANHHLMERPGRPQGKQCAVRRRRSERKKTRQTGLTSDETTAGAPRASNSKNWKHFILEIHQTSDFWSKKNGNFLFFGEKGAGGDFMFRLKKWACAHPLCTGGDCELN